MFQNGRDINIQLILFLTGFLLSLSSPAADESIIGNFLTDVRENSLKIKIVNDSSQSSLISKQISLNVLKPTGYFSGSTNNDELPPTSPFSSINSEISTYSLGVAKQWSFGLNTELSYSMTDTFRQYSSNPDVNYMQPSIQLDFETSLFQDIFSQRYQHLLNNVELEEKALKINTKIERKAIVVQALLDLANYLESIEEKTLLEDQCSKTSGQARKLSQKRRRQSISQREYLLSVKELNVCEANIEAVKKKLIEQSESIESTYGIKLSKYSGVDPGRIFSNLQESYLRLQTRSGDVSLSNKDEMLLVQTELEALKEKQSELEAKAKTNLKLGLSTGFTGVGDTLSEGQEQISDQEYPFVYMSVRLDFPLKDRDAEGNALANKYKLQALEKTKDLTEQQIQLRYSTLKKTIENDIKIYQKYVDNVNLSEKIVAEGRRDFNNGRLDFYSLTELSKSLLQSQRTLSGHRIQFLIRVVEYLDYYQYFDEYL
ncbi:MAG: TolC family protein [Bdellovibrionales bacterium]